MRSPMESAGGRRHAWIRSNILGLVAIFIALSGTAVAAQVVTKDGATQAAKKKKKAKAGPPGPAGPAGPAGSAVAFAHVNANGTLDTANSKNISATVESASDGYYCVTPSVAVRSMIATADSSAGGGNFNASASFTDNFTGCPDGAVTVTTYNNASAGALSGSAFWLVFN